MLPDHFGQHQPRQHLRRAEHAKGYATVRGYSVGWAAHKYREQFGVWPNDPRIRCATASPPSLKTKNWIVSRQIAFAKGRRGHG
jgi:hypothetical protein